MVGKYIELPDAYTSVIDALKHGGLKNRVSVNIKLIDSQDVETRGVEILKGLDAILVPGGFGSVSYTHRPIVRYSKPSLVRCPGMTQMGCA